MQSQRCTGTAIQCGGVKRTARHSWQRLLDRLNAQHVLLPTVLSGIAVTIVDDVAKAPKAQSRTVLNLLEQVVRLVQLLLTVPASAASGECSFSALHADPPHASPSPACPPTKNWKAVP